MLTMYLQITGFNILLPYFINIFKVRIDLCFELNIVDDLKIVDYRKVIVMHQTVPFLCHMIL